MDYLIINYYELIMNEAINLYEFLCVQDQNVQSATSSKHSYMDYNLDY